MEPVLGVFQKLVLRGGILLVLGVAGSAGLHRLQRQGLLAQQRRVAWLPLTLLITGGAIACVAVGVLAIGRGLVGDDGAWIDGLLVAVLVAVVGAITMFRDRSRPGVPPTAAS